jgi:predicted FMN-binding regulatory protein PaiB
VVVLTVQLQVSPPVAAAAAAAAAAAEMLFAAVPIEMEVVEVVAAALQQNREMADSHGALADAAQVLAATAEDSSARAVRAPSLSPGTRRGI